jgi:hypothetical protein
MHVLRVVLLVATGLLSAAAIAFLLWSRFVWNHYRELGRKPNQPRIGAAIEVENPKRDTSGNPDSITAQLSQCAAQRTMIPSR